MRTATIDRVCLPGVGLAVVAAVEEPDLFGELVRDVNDVLASRTGVAAPGVVRCRWLLGPPDPLRPRLASVRFAVYPARSVVNRADPENPSGSSTTSTVADNVWESTPMMTSSGCCLMPCSRQSSNRCGRGGGSATESGAALLEPHPVTVLGAVNRWRATPTKLLGSRLESVPPSPAPSWDRLSRPGISSTLWGCAPSGDRRRPGRRG